MERGVQHSRHADVVDVPAVAEREVARLVAHRARTDATGGIGSNFLPERHGLDGVEHLHVPGAAAQVRAEVARHVVALQLGALLVDLRLGAHHDAGDAEPALQTAARGECIGEPSALRIVETFECDDFTTSYLLERVGARDLYLAVDHHGAATTLPRRRASVLG